MAKHLIDPKNALRDPWVIAVIIAEIVAVCFLVATIPALQNDAESLGKLLAFLLELLRAAGFYIGR